MTRVLALVVAASLSGLVGGEAHRRTENGNALYRKGQNAPAMDEYQKAQTVVPEAPQLHYDIGNALYRQENWTGAAEEYERALGAAGPDLAPKAAYNLGNALFHDEKYDDAVKAYTRALKSAPKDADTKHNLELALRALEEKKQQQKQQKPKDDKKNDQKQDQKQNGGQQPKPGGDQKPQPSQSNDQNKNEQKNAGQKPGQMSAEDAKKLLDRLNDQERDNVKREQARMAKNDERTPEKDW